MNFFFISKCLKNPSRRMIGGNKEQQQNKEEAGTKEEEEIQRNQMISEGGYCCSTPNCLGLPSTGPVHNHPKNRVIIITTTARTSRSNFAKATTSTLFPNVEFTNHESLPCLSQAFSTFTQTYPAYIETQEADVIRERDYSHLTNHTCLDYTGLGLFSHSQSLSRSDFFAISYKSASLASQAQDTGLLESAIRSRIMSFLNISQDDYTMACTANRTSAFKLLVETYPFHTRKKLLTVYDYESEDVRAMAESARKRGAKVMSASFQWPNLRIHSARLKRMLRKKKKKKGGLFVFPLQSRMTGVRYPYVWMRMAQENGWDVVLDACALGPKDMDSFGLSLIQPDFIICNFFKITGENPSGFASLLVKKSSSGSVLETSLMGRSVGVVSIVPPRSISQLTDDISSDIDASNSFSNGSTLKNNGMMDRFEQGETSSEPWVTTASMGTKENEERMTQSEIVELECESVEDISVRVESRRNAGLEMECSGLDHADSLGLLLISSRLRYITNWLVIALMKLHHPNSENNHSLVRIYGPRIKFERAPAIAFNVFDWKGERIDPALVQKLADRSNISLSCGFLRNIYFSEKYEGDKDAILERRNSSQMIPVSGNKRKEEIDLGITVVNATLGFLTNFEDAYKLWSFVAKFLDADFVEKERWRYMALNQKMIEV